MRISSPKPLVGPPKNSLHGNAVYCIMQIPYLSCVLILCVTLWTCDTIPKGINISLYLQGVAFACLLGWQEVRSITLSLSVALYSVADSLQLQHCSNYLVSAIELFTWKHILLCERKDKQVQLYTFCCEFFLSYSQGKRRKDEACQPILDDCDKE